VYVAGQVKSIERDGVENAMQRPTLKQSLVFLSSQIPYLPALPDQFPLQNLVHTQTQLGYLGHKTFLGEMALRGPGSRAAQDLVVPATNQDRECAGCAFAVVVPFLTENDSVEIVEKVAEDDAKTERPIEDVVTLWRKRYRETFHKRAVDVLDQRYDQPLMDHSEGVVPFGHDDWVDGLVLYEGVDEGEVILRSGDQRHDELLAEGG
jgi:hypothetical protein